MEKVIFTKAKNDVYGNERVIVWFPELMTKEDQQNSEPGEILKDVNAALYNAKKLGGKKYKGKDFAGGIVFNWHPDLESDIQKMRGW